MISRHRLQLSAGALLAAAVGAVGCVSADDIEGLHRQMNDIETQIQALERKSSSKEEVARLNSSVSEQTQQLLKSNADTGVKLGELSTAIEQLQSKLEDTNRRLSQLSQQIAETQGDLLRMRGGTSALPPGTPPGAPSSTNPTSPRIGEPARTPSKRRGGEAGRGPSELYDTAYATTRRGAMPSRSRAFRSTSSPILRPTSPTTASTGSESRTTPRRNIRKRSPTSTGSSRSGPGATRLPPRC